jgi:SAM-dependent methyltransferase
MRPTTAFPFERPARRFDGFILKGPKRFPGFCLVCGKPTYFSVHDPNFRESCICKRCSAFNRQRQIAFVIGQGRGARERYSSLARLARGSKQAIYNTESSRAVHDTLKSMSTYRASEYLGPDRPSGAVINAVMHQDLEQLSFEDASFDLVISGDVFEHVPHPYRGHAELFRVLKPGGRHVFTVPFHQHQFQDDVRAETGGDARPALLKDPIYHMDPVRPEGALVYTIFALEMLVKLSQLGFRTNVYHLYKPWYGILGTNAIVFEAIKPDEAGRAAAEPHGSGRGRAHGHRRRRPSVPPD